MTHLQAHFLDARGDLTAIHDWLERRLVDAHAKAAALLPLGPIDVVVQAGRHVIPDKGHVGYAPGAGLIQVTVDTTNTAWLSNRDQSIERMFVHELHHSSRWDGPGYGTSLGDTLVSEGLAGHSAQEVLGGPCEPWECLSLTSSTVISL